uniref:Delta(3,5)-Delta(2,4)-dienoyl-CoA isomerase, mitochondrial n=1 Tax=Steinernema glaseri TaxID=37863 RepID=A0A1I7ZT94_9BILA
MWPERRGRSVAQFVNIRVHSLLSRSAQSLWASKEAIFSIKEVDIGLSADVGSINRLPKSCGNNSWVRELAFSARNFGAQEALQNGLLSRVFESPEECLQASLKLASELSKKSPVAVQGTKVNLNYSRDHTVKESLEYIALWNQSQLFTEDIPKSVMAAVTKSQPPMYAKL